MLNINCSIMKKNVFSFLFACIAYFSANAQWSTVNYTYSMEVYDLHFINEQVGFAAGYHQVYKTPDGGQNWILIADNVFINGPVGVWFFDENIGLIIGSDGGGYPQVSKTINGGNSWSTSTLPVSSMDFNDPNKIFFFDNNTGYIVCRSGYIYKTVNQGADWTQLTSGVTDDLGSIYFPTANIGYVTLEYSHFFLKTINGGNSWTMLNTGQLSSVYDVYFTSADTGYFACSNSKILMTTNGGASWSAFDFGTSDYFYTIEFTSKNVGYTAGSSGTIVATTNGGITWLPIPSGINKLLYCMDFPSPLVGYIGTLDLPPAIIKTTNGGGIYSIGNLNGNTYISLQPNPADDVVTVSSTRVMVGSEYYFIDQQGKVALSGKITGEKMHIDVRQLVTGVYIFRLGEQNMQGLKLNKK